MRKISEGKQKALAYIRKYGEADKQELIELIRPYETIPAPEELENRYLGSRVAQYMASDKDPDGFRRIVAEKRKRCSRYIVVKVCKNIEMLKNIYRRFSNTVMGMRKNMRTVGTCIHSLQESMFDEKGQFRSFEERKHAQK